MAPKKLKEVKWPFGFVIMPFSSDFNDVYVNLIKPACRLAKVRCERVDEQAFDDLIVERIHQNIQSAELVIADLTTANANVYYEVGYAKAHGKRVVAITQSFDDLRFDFRSFNVFKYDRTAIASNVDDLGRIIADRIRIAPKGFDILGVHEKSADIQTVIGDYLKSARETVYFSGTHFGIMLSDRRSELMSLLDDGVKMVFHVLDPASEAVAVTATSVFSMRESELRAECETGFTNLRGLISDARARKCKGSVDVYLSSEPVRARYMLFDHERDNGRVVVVPYVNHRRASHSPSLVFRSGASVAQVYASCCLDEIARATKIIV